MNNPVLHSEGYERASSLLRHSFPDFQRSVETFQESVNLFQRTVEKQQRILGMQSENIRCVACGQPPTYTEEDFANI